MGAVGGDGGYRVSSEQRLAARQNLAAYVVQVLGRTAGGADDGLVLVLREIRRRDDGADAGRGFGARGIYAQNVGVGVRASQNLAVQHTGQRHVRAVSRLAGDLVVSVVSDRAGADHFVISSLGSHVGVYLRVLGYGWLVCGDYNTDVKRVGDQGI